MDLKELLKGAVADLKASSADPAKINELEARLKVVEGELATVTADRDALKTERDGLKSQVETLSAGKLAPELLTALSAAGIDTAEKLAAKLADADALAAQQADKRTEALTRLAALYTGEELESEKTLLAALTDGPVLDRQLARINADYDKKFGTNGKTPAARVSAPSPVAKVALPAAGGTPVAFAPEQKEAEQERARRAF